MKQGLQTAKCAIVATASLRTSATAQPAQCCCAYIPRSHTASCTGHLLQHHSQHLSAAHLRQTNGIGTVLYMACFLRDPNASPPEMSMDMVSCQGPFPVLGNSLLKQIWIIPSQFNKITNEIFASMIRIKFCLESTLEGKDRLLSVVLNALKTFYSENHLLTRAK